MYVYIWKQVHVWFGVHGSRLGFPNWNWCQPENLPSIVQHQLSAKNGEDCPCRAWGLNMCHGSLGKVAFFGRLGCMQPVAMFTSNSHADAIASGSGHSRTKFANHVPFLETRSGVADYASRYASVQ